MTAGAAVAIVGALLGVLQLSPILWLPALLGGGTLFVWARTASRRRGELEIDDLGDGDSGPLQSRLRALDDFKNLIAEGDILCEERLPDGVLRPLSQATLPAFIADHGALLVLSRDQAIWKCIPRRPIPMSPLWVKVGSRVATSVITSRTILDTPDRELFDRRIDWLLHAADQNNAKAKSFRQGVQLILALRRREFDGLTFEQKKERLLDEAFSASRIEKMHAGVYQPFETFLAKLPLHEFP